MKKTTQLTLNKPEQVILDEAISFYLLHNTDTSLTHDGVLKLCSIRIKIGDNLGVISGFSKQSYKEMAEQMSNDFLRKQLK